MNRYETIFMVDTDTPDEEQESIFEKIRQLLSQQGGTLLIFDDWGVRKFAYEIKKKRQGRYIRLDYCGDGELVHDLERFLRLDFHILKFMTIRLDVDVDPESIIAEGNLSQESQEEAVEEQSDTETEEPTDEARDAEPETENRTDSVNEE